MKIWRQSKKRSVEISAENSNYYENSVDDKKALAKRIVGYSVLVRKSEQSLNPESVLIVLAIVSLAWFFMWRLEVRAVRSQQKQQAIATRIALGSNSYDALSQLQVTPMVSQIVLPTDTPMPTMVPSPTVTIGPKSELVFLKLSFYDPNIGSIIPDIADINCALFDHINRVCVSTMANGVPFGQYYGKVVACPPPMQHGDVLEVSYPVQLAGNWTCMDRGWAIEYPYVDFLLRYPDMIWTGYNLNNFPWSTTVQARWVHP